MSVYQTELPCDAKILFCLKEEEEEEKKVSIFCQMAQRKILSQN
jgi:hypothetical protein